MGPEPMTSTFLMSLFSGIRLASPLVLLSPHVVDETVEQKRGVVGAGARLRMELDREGIPVGVVDAFAGLVVRVDVSLFPALHRLGDHRVAVVLARDEGPGPFDVSAGLVDAPVTVFEFRGSGAGGDGRQLMSETDAEDRLHAEEFGDLHDLVLRPPGPRDRSTA